MQELNPSLACIRNVCVHLNLLMHYRHLSRFHNQTVDQQQVTDLQIKFLCLHCEFLEPFCSEAEYFAHLRTAHLKVNQS